MKAGSLSSTYRRIFEVYQSLDENGDGHLDDEELEIMIERLGVSHEVSTTDLKSIKELCDIDGDHTISLKEFIVALTILYLLKAVPALRSKTKFMDKKDCQRVLGAVDMLMLEGDGDDKIEADNNIEADTKSNVIENNQEENKSATIHSTQEFESSASNRVDLDLYASTGNVNTTAVISGSASPIDKKGNPVFLGFSNDIHYLVHWVVAAYLIFDDKCKGCIARSTITEMQRHNQDDGNDLFLQEDRWKELDWDQNGEVSFEEFVFAFSEWIRDFSGDEGEDEENHNKQEEQQPVVTVKKSSSKKL
eukprot:CAMPEP_0197309252 /NCGR_PEP_ID=MMETSP0891-20130614/7812_1 /TAXON_ID=44058 ORGANISM="Aureoumbra lagunensis, Strain CCMP1510" /NCGR_SAMPLE_ID=MMETSP0891 /ASSEMBLY_ACC=CAM_ASM_000534 /LENGTH=305 /DNA_ID=CAMNT_0042794209 /DNA_START=269 /DNA_END=1186 /DNA_ORIENTATION=+